jgi:hypothetical protein
MARPQGKNCLTREQVFRRINKEREYQIQRWGVETGLGMHEIQKDTESYILYMLRFLNQAMEKISTQPDNKEALEEIRKVTALGVVCLEQNGCPKRSLKGVKNKR